MKILKNRKKLLEYIEKQKEKNIKTGFAPTMGAFHEGHLSLYEAAKQDGNDLVISSIFVNPTQFNNLEDLENYPRTVEKDLEILEKQNIVDAVYIPRVQDIYPHGARSKTYDFDGLENEMEGKFRAGHFDGVGTVVEELFLQIRPDRAYFGEKDFQQLQIIKKMVEKKKLPVEIRSVPIFREKNGLAMSSRNRRLSAEDFEGAALIYQTLLKVKNWFRVLSVPEIDERVKEIFECSKYDLEYFIIADEETLKETDFFYKDRNYRAFIAVLVPPVRLIDNMKLS